jgi:hypothetical protein
MRLTAQRSARASLLGNLAPLPPIRIDSERKLWTGACERCPNTNTLCYAIRRAIRRLRLPVESAGRLHMLVHEYARVVLQGHAIYVGKPAALTTRNLLIARCDESYQSCQMGCFPAKFLPKNVVATQLRHLSVLHDSQRARIHFRKSHPGKRAISIARFSPGAASGIES